MNGSVPLSKALRAHPLSTNDVFGTRGVRYDKPTGVYKPRATTERCQFLAAQQESSAWVSTTSLALMTTSSTTATTATSTTSTTSTTTATTATTMDNGNDVKKSTLKKRDARLVTGFIIKKPRFIEPIVVEPIVVEPIVVEPIVPFDTIDDTDDDDTVSVLSNDDSIIDGGVAEEWSCLANDPEPSPFTGKVCPRVDDDNLDELIIKIMAPETTSTTTTTSIEEILRVELAYVDEIDNKRATTGSGGASPTGYDDYGKVVQATKDLVIEAFKIDTKPRNGDVKQFKGQFQFPYELRLLPQSVNRETVYETEEQRNTRGWDELKATRDELESLSFQAMEDEYRVMFHTSSICETVEKLRMSLLCGGWVTSTPGLVQARADLEKLNFADLEEKYRVHHKGRSSSFSKGTSPKNKRKKLVNNIIRFEMQARNGVVKED